MQEEQITQSQNQSTSKPLSQEVPKKKNKIGIILIAFLVLIVGIIIGGFIYFRQTPQYSLYLMSKAVEKKDYNSFVKYFNVDAVVDDLLEKVVAESNKQMEEQTGLDEAQKQVLQQQLEFTITQYKDQMKEQSRAEIKKQVEGGSFYADFKGALLSSFLNTKVTRKGNEADIVIIDKKNNKSLPLKMRKKSGYWEVYKINSDIQEIQKLMGN